MSVTAQFEVSQLCRSIVSSDLQLLNADASVFSSQLVVTQLDAGKELSDQHCCQAQEMLVSFQLVVFQLETFRVLSEWQFCHTYEKSTKLLVHATTFQVLRSRYSSDQQLAKHLDIEVSAVQFVTSHPERLHERNDQQFENVEVMVVGFHLLVSQRCRSSS